MKRASKIKVEHNLTNSYPGLREKFATGDMIKIKVVSNLGLWYEKHEGKTFIISSIDSEYDVARLEGEDGKGAWLQDIVLLIPAKQREMYKEIKE